MHGQHDDVRMGGEATYPTYRNRRRIAVEVYVEKQNIWLYFFRDAAGIRGGPSLANNIEVGVAGEDCRYPLPK